MSDSALVAAIRDHARKHYSEGWDIVIECWEDSDIVERIAGATTEAEAIAKVQRIVSLMEERRAEIQAEVF